MAKPFPKCKMCDNLVNKRHCTYCSRVCYGSDPDVKEALAVRRRGKKQSAEIIAKRLANTDQKAKEAKRKRTMTERYGIDNWTKDPEKAAARKSIKGRTNPRQPGQQDRIIATRRANGTLKHSELTKAKIRASNHLRYSDPDHDRSVYVSKPRNPNTGYYRGLYYRSSYELKFLKFCRYFRIEVIGAGTKEFAVPYIDAKGVRRMYYPDFYLPKHKTLIEIKPFEMLDVGSNPLKFQAAAECRDNFVILTEADGFLERSEWQDFYESDIMEWIV